MKRERRENRLQCPLLLPRPEMFGIQYFKPLSCYVARREGMGKEEVRRPAKAKR